MDKTPRLATPSAEYIPHSYWIGTYTTNGSQGIYHAAWADSPLTTLAARMENPSWLTSVPGGFILACSETSEAAHDNHQKSLLQLYRTAANDELEPVASTSTGAQGACHIGYAPGQALAAVAHYSGGSVSLLRFDLADGLIQPLQLINLAGLGVEPTQPSPQAHAHCCVFTRDEKTLLVCDLGQDALFSFTVQTGPRPLNFAGRVALPSGCGPRHLVLSPDERRAYVVCELSNQLMVVDLSRNSVTAALELVEPGFTEFAAAAAIRFSPEGKTLAVSCRGNDTVTLYRLDAADVPQEATRIATAAWPRDIAFTADGHWLLVACEKGNTVQVFDRLCDWKRIPEMELAVSMPVCLLEKAPM